MDTLRFWAVGLAVGIIIAWIVYGIYHFRLDLKVQKFISRWRKVIPKKVKQGVIPKMTDEEILLEDLFKPVAVKPDKGWQELIKDWEIESEELPKAA